MDTLNGGSGRFYREGCETWCNVDKPADGAVNGQNDDRSFRSISYALNAGNNALDDGDGTDGLHGQR